MTWKISDKEYEAVLALPEPKRDSHFVKRVAAWEEVWSLRGQSGWVMAEDETGAKAFPVWPHERYARACATEAWAGCDPASIALTAFMEKWLPGMKRDKMWVAVFPKLNCSSAILEPARLENDLLEECERY